MTTAEVNQALLDGKALQGVSTRDLLIIQDQLLTNVISGGAGGTGKATSGYGSPVGVVDPAAFVLFVQLDSDPPGQTWWSDGVNWN